MIQSLCIFTSFTFTDSLIVVVVVFVVIVVVAVMMVVIAVDVTRRRASRGFVFFVAGIEKLRVGFGVQKRIFIRCKRKFGLTADDWYGQIVKSANSRTDSILGLFLDCWAV